MSLKLDDLIGKKKEVVQILDLSKATANNAEEFKKVMEKVPDFKIKPEKVRPEDVRTQDRPRRWRRRPKRQEYQFADPVPQEMRALRLEDLCSVPIQWNMLTTLRPKAKIDEEYFSRLVELGKLELSTREREKRVPATDLVRRSKGRSGESRFLSCPECGEDFCQREVCHLLQYDSFKRQAVPETIGKKNEEERGRGKGKRRGKGKVRKSRSLGRSKSGQRSASTSKRSKSRGGSKSGSRSKSRGRSKSGERSKSAGRSKSRERSKSRTGAKEDQQTKPSRKKITSRTRRPSKSSQRKSKKKPPQ